MENKQYKDRKEYMRPYQKEWVAKRRSEFFKDKKCEKCGSIEKLVIHHVNPKEKEANSIWSWSQKRREAELAKCVIWCEKCHIEHHAAILRNKEITHGTAGGYWRGCRCSMCRKYQSDRMKKYFAKIKEGIS